MGNWKVQRETLCQVITEMANAGLVAGSSGNASLRLSGAGGDGLVLITPTSRPYRELDVEDLVVVDLDGEQVEGDLSPSFELALHLTLYKSRKDIGAVVHTHSLYASVAAVAGLEIPPVVDEMVMKVGGGVRVAEYGFPSTEELAHRARVALGERNAVLLRNHGLAAVGRTAWDALDVSQLVERVAQIFVYASLLGRSNPLAPDIVNMERDLFQMQRSVGSREAPFDAP